MQITRWAHCQRQVAFFSIGCLQAINDKITIGHQSSYATCSIMGDKSSEEMKLSPTRKISDI